MMLYLMAMAIPAAAPNERAVGGISTPRELYYHFWFLNSGDDMLISAPIYLIAHFWKMTSRGCGTPST